MAMIYSNKTERVILHAPAKLNLFLEVGEHRPDGYHNIDTIMHSALLCDTVLLETADITSLSCSIPELSGRENLAYRAAAEFTAAAGLDCPVKITIQKNIPVAGGLAGGSADAAAVLRGLDMIYPGTVEQSRLMIIAARLGADVPFCLIGGTMRAEGIGEILTPVSPLPECSVLILYGIGTKTSTASAYAALDATKRVHIENNMPDALASGSIEVVCAALYNVFELLYPEIETLKQQIISTGAIGALMSGSGPSLFGIYRHIDERDYAIRKLTELGYNVLPA